MASLSCLFVSFLTFSFFIAAFVSLLFLFDYLSSRLFIPQYLCPHPTSRLMDFWNSLPPFCSLRTLMFNIFSPKKPLLSLRLSPSSLFTLCFTPSFQRLQTHLKIDFWYCAETFSFLCGADSNQSKRQTKTKKKKSATTEMVNDDQSVHNYKQNTAQKRFIILSSLIMCTFFF